MKRQVRVWVCRILGLWGYGDPVWDGYGDRNSVPTTALAVPTKWRSYRDSDVTVTPLHPVYSVFFRDTYSHISISNNDILLHAGGDRRGMGRPNAVSCRIVCVCLFARSQKKENGSSYQHQSRRR